VRLTGKKSGFYPNHFLLINKVKELSFKLLRIYTAKHYLSRF